MQVLRVHDVAETAQALALWRAVGDQGATAGRVASNYRAEFAKQTRKSESEVKPDMPKMWSEQPVLAEAVEEVEADRIFATIFPVG